MWFCNLGDQQFKRTSDRNYYDIELLRSVVISSVCHERQQNKSPRSNISAGNTENRHKNVLIFSE